MMTIDHIDQSIQHIIYVVYFIGIDHHHRMRPTTPRLPTRPTTHDPPRIKLTKNILFYTTSILILH